MTTTIDATQLKNLLTRLNATNWGMWPPAEEWPDLGAPYTCVQFAGPVTMAKFDAPVQVGERRATRFAVGGRLNVRGCVRLA